MKAAFILLLTAGTIISACQKKEAPDELTVQLEKVAGSGPFYPGKGALSALRTESELAPLYEEITGLPDELDSLVEIGQWEADFLQWIYQGYHNQQIDSALAHRWLDMIKPEDTVKYTKEKIDGQIAIAFGKNSSGQKIVIVDTNNNEDFSDDKIFTFTKEDSLAFSGEPSATQDRVAVFLVKFDNYVNNKIIEDEVWLQINPYFYNRFWIGTLEHRKGSTKVNGKEYFFSVSNGFSRFVFNADYLQVVAEDSLIEEYVQKHPPDSIFGYKEMVHLGGELYQITDVSRSGDQLTLKRHPKDEPWRGTQMGALAYEIDTITLAGDKYRVPNGKITMIDFWGTWCGPCIGELPFLKDTHALFAEDQFELIGIASDDREDLQKFVEVNEIHWPQIHQGKENRGIIEQYGIRGYPTTFLIDREGKIIAKNSTLRGHQLVETLANVLEISENNLQQKITEGNVLIKISGEKHENWIIKGDFTDDQSIPLYLVEDKWQRGFTLKPGQYSYELKSRNRVSETLEGSFVVHAQEEPIEIVLPSLANL